MLQTHYTIMFLISFLAN